MLCGHAHVMLCTALLRQWQRAAQWSARERARHCPQTDESVHATAVSFLAGSCGNVSVKRAVAATALPPQTRRQASWRGRLGEPPTSTRPGPLHARMHAIIATASSNTPSGPSFGGRQPRRHARRISDGERARHANDAPARCPGGGRGATERGIVHARDPTWCAQSARRT